MVKAICDGCGSGTDLGVFATLPTGWIRVTQIVSAPDPDTTRDYCSWVCVYAVASNRAALEQQSKADAAQLLNENGGRPV